MSFPSDECSHLPPIQLHNAYDFETVTIYYRWHPLFGLSLPVRKRRKDRDGECIYCESDGKIYPLPSWMLSPECSQFSLGAALVSTEHFLDFTICSRLCLFTSIALKLV